MQLHTGVRRRPASQAALVASAVLYAVFQGSAVLATDDSDGLWWLGLVVHGVLLVSSMIGLTGARKRFGLEGRARTAWTVSTVLAFLGLTVGHVFWAAAMFGIAAVTMLVLQRRVVAGVITMGAVGWLWLYAIGVRIGDANGRLITTGERRAAVASLMLMCVGLVALGSSSRQRSRPAV